MAGARRVRPLSGWSPTEPSWEPPVRRAAQGMRTQCTDLNYFEQTFGVAAFEMADRVPPNRGPARQRSTGGLYGHTSPLSARL